MCGISESYRFVAHTKKVSSLTQNTASALYRLRGSIAGIEDHKIDLIRMPHTEVYRNNSKKLIKVRNTHNLQMNDRFREFIIIL